jgi:hypothetical protein
VSSATSATCSLSSSPAADPACLASRSAHMTGSLTGPERLAAERQIRNVDWRHRPGSPDFGAGAPCQRCRKRRGTRSCSPKRRLMPGNLDLRSTARPTSTDAASPVTTADQGDLVSHHPDAPPISSAIRVRRWRQGARCDASAQVVRQLQPVPAKQLRRHMVSVAEQHWEGLPGTTLLPVHHRVSLLQIGVADVEPADFGPTRPSGENEQHRIARVCATHPDPLLHATEANLAPSVQTATIAMSPPCSFQRP